MATQRLLQPSVREARPRVSRPADSLVQIVSILGTRRRELKASVGERLLLLEARTFAFESRHVELEERLASLEGHLERLDHALRPEAGPDLAPARMHQVGSVLMYAGGLLVLWVVLLELGVALGLS